MAAAFFFTTVFLPGARFFAAFVAFVAFVAFAAFIAFAAAFSALTSCFSKRPSTSAKSWAFSGVCPGPWAGRFRRAFALPAPSRACRSATRRYLSRRLRARATSRFSTAGVNATTALGWLALTRSNSDFVQSARAFWIEMAIDSLR